jgi:4'-phosphopantetheinyl transferase
MINKLTANTIHIATIDSSPTIYYEDLYQEILSKDEKTRADKFYFEHHRKNFIIFRATLRQTVSKHLNISAEKIKFKYAKFGKPEIITAQNKQNIQFNISHSENIALIAICKNKHIGIDIEQVRDLKDYQKISERFFSKKENQAVLKEPIKNQIKTFFQIWTRKEALIKASGKGLFQNLNSFSTIYSKNAKTKKITLDPNQTFILQDIQAATNFKSAICIKNSKPANLIFIS